MKQDVTSAEHHHGVVVVDKVDALVQVRADIAGRERAAGPEADQDSRRPLEHQASPRHVLRRLLRPTTAVSLDVDELSVNRNLPLDEAHLRHRDSAVIDPERPEVRRQARPDLQIVGLHPNRHVREAHRECVRCGHRGDQRSGIHRRA
jgi:hypothetical protein